ncbi:MAG: methylated-DNA--[protein]-cysteine S-methyltransferase [Nitrococcus sp.]|nr:methylated-DNA--[protein]-cysteine S-methyltransferase [Nitrococcus sp.]
MRGRGALSCEKMASGAASRVDVNRPSSGDYDVVVAAPFGAVAVRCDEAAVIGLYLFSQELTPTWAVSGFAAQVAAELKAYLMDGSRALMLPVRTKGTVFQHRVWQRLRRIPPGTRCTYGALARELGTSARAIGGACRANPVPLVVPCHRVVAAAGIGGFAGFVEGGMHAIKGWLLEHERLWLDFAPERAHFQETY